MQRPGFNFAAPSYFQRPDERTVIGMFAHYDEENLEAYTELMFMDTKLITLLPQEISSRVSIRIAGILLE